MTRLGPYRIVRLLGRGGMAEVWLGVAVGASGFEKQVALKCLRPELRGDATLERLLIEEAKLGARLQHRNLVEVHDLGVDAGTYYVRMGYIDGGDVATRLKRGPAPLPVALHLVTEVLAALAYLHGALASDGQPLGLLHRDVSPGNLLVSRAGDVKLSDLGLAKATMLRDQTRANVRKGTYAYMSPEQVTGAKLGPQSDLFSVGVLLHELVCGTRPFDGDTPHETMQRIVGAEPAWGDELSREMKAVLETCFAKDPAKRARDAAALRRQLGGTSQETDALVSWLFDEV